MGFRLKFSQQNQSSEPMVSVAAMAMMFCQDPDCGPSFLHMQSAQATLADGNQQRLQNNRGAWRAVWDL